MIACTPGPREIAYGAEQCAYCRMTVTDSRFAAQVVLAKGKVQTFDSIECMLAFLASLDEADAPRQVVVSDFDHPARLVPADQAWFVRATAVGSPMGTEWSLSLDLVRATVARRAVAEQPSRAAATPTPQEQDRCEPDESLDLSWPPEPSRC